MESNRTYKILLTLGGIALAVILSLPYILFKQQLREAPAWGYVGILLSCMISNASILLPTSSTLIVLTASMTLNPLLCILFGGIGAGMGEQVSYVCGRIGLSWIDPEKSGLSRISKNRMIAWFEKNAVLTVFLFAFLPLPCFDLAGLIAGARKMNWPLFAFAAVAGKVLKFLLAVLGVRYLLPIYIQMLPENVRSLLLEKFGEYALMAGEGTF